MGQSELLAYLCEHLLRTKIPYFITGSQATIAFGEPRFTNDIDVVIDLNLTNLVAFCEGFPDEEFYLSLGAAREAVETCGMFSIIHPTSGLKIDVVVPQPSSFDQLRLERAVQLPLSTGGFAIFSSPEDIVVKKMEWHHMGGGERHLRDIEGVLRVQGESLDRAYITTQCEKLGVSTIWQSLLDKLES